MNRHRSTHRRRGWLRPAGLFRRTAILLAALPLLQLGACGTFIGQSLGTAINELPSNAYSTLFGLSLLPSQIGLALFTGGFGSTGTGGGGGGGLGGIAGVGGTTSPVGTGGLGGLGATGI
jgi:hypothetical protein